VFFLANQYVVSFELTNAGSIDTTEMQTMFSNLVPYTFGALSVNCDALGAGSHSCSCTFIGDVDVLTVAQSRVESSEFQAEWDVAMTSSSMAGASTTWSYASGGDLFKFILFILIRYIYIFLI